MEYQNLIFIRSNPGFLNNIYKSKQSKRYYNLQWDNGYDNYPRFYSATKDGEANCPIRKDAIPFFVFPEGHEHYEGMLKESIKEESFNQE